MHAFFEQMFTLYLRKKKGKLVPFYRTTILHHINIVNMSLMLRIDAFLHLCWGFSGRDTRSSLMAGPVEI